MKQYKNKRCLVTGGLGFIGSNLAIKLVELGAIVTVLDKMDPLCGGNMFNIDPVKNKVDVIIGDMCDENLVRPLVENTDYIFNLAGSVSHIGGETLPLDDLKLNTQSHLTLLNLCKGLDVKIVYTGSRSQYGQTTNPPIKETTACNPTDINGINKLAAEQYHLLFHKNYGLKTCCLRLTNTFGPRMPMKNNSFGFVNLFVRETIDGHPITLFGDGGQLRDFSYVDDVVDALLVCMISSKAWGEVFNVGIGIPLNVRNMAEMIVTVANKGKIILKKWPKSREKIEVGDYYANINKIMGLTKWQPTTSLDESLKTTIDYFTKYKKYYW